MDCAREEKLPFSTPPPHSVVSPRHFVYGQHLSASFDVSHFLHSAGCLAYPFFEQRNFQQHKTTEINGFQMLTFGINNADGHKMSAEQRHSGSIIKCI